VLQLAVTGRCNRTPSSATDSLFSALCRLAAVAAGAHSQKVSSLLNLLNKMTVELTFENVHQLLGTDTKTLSKKAQLPAGLFGVYTTERQKIKQS